MAFITDKAQAQAIYDGLQSKDISVAVFCTASHWNTEAILLAAQRFAEKHNVRRIPISLAITFNYTHMPQAKRVTYASDPVIGFKSVLAHAKLLCEGKGAPYPNVDVMPHLDHGDPELDTWALTEGTEYLASVMFDAQRFSFEENIAMTKQYVKEHGDRVLVEGIIDMLKVSDGTEAKSGEDYAEKARRFKNETNVDFIVADLGTEQQSDTIRDVAYKKDRAKKLTEELGKRMLVLHGTSCLNNEQIKQLPEDGIIRINLWTKVAREAGQYAADKLVQRYDKIQKNDFESAESRQYIYDSIEKASDMMEELLGLFGYKNLE